MTPPGLEDARQGHQKADIQDHASSRLIKRGVITRPNSEPLRKPGVNDPLRLLVADLRHRDLESLRGLDVHLLDRTLDGFLFATSNHPAQVVQLLANDIDAPAGYHCSTGQRRMGGE